MDSTFTVGHSNRPLAEFLSILEAHNLNFVIDVRRFPSSRKWPHFDAADLASSLRAAGLNYAGMPELGGRRRPLAESPHRAWRVEAFRGFADFLDTPDAAAALERISALARQNRCVLMCAEALPWRCHRSLIADALIVRGWNVFDVLSQKEARPHRLPEFARVEGTRVIYDVAPSSDRGPRTED